MTKTKENCALQKWKAEKYIQVIFDESTDIFQNCTFSELIVNIMEYTLWIRINYYTRNMMDNSKEASKCTLYEVLDVIDVL